MGKGNKTTLKGGGGKKQELGIKKSLNLKVVKASGKKRGSVDGVRYPSNKPYDY